MLVVAVVSTRYTGKMLEKLRKRKNKKIKKVVGGKAPENNDIIQDLKCDILDENEENISKSL